MRTLKISLLVFILPITISAQWYQQNSGTTTHLYSVFFIDENTGWTCGDSGKIIKTTNGGLDWLEQNSNTIAYLRVIQFIDQNNGWAYGYHQILNTTNGGTTWNVQDFPPPAYIVALQYINLNTGWFIYHSSDTSYIAKTTNGGNSWTIQFQSQNEDCDAIYFLDENYGWASFIGGVLKTTNGGMNWTQYTANFAGSPMCIRFADHQTGWISSNTLGSYDISKSTDGGMTWFNQKFASGQYIHSISCPNDSTVYAAGFIFFVPPNPRKEFILKTTDGGTTWFEQYNGDGTLNSIFFINDITGWAVGWFGTILHTNNGGTPVELVSFYVDYIESDNAVELTWSTATETNNSGFEILRFAQNDNDEWNKIGFVPGHGTKTETQHYSFTDNDVKPGKYQYKLKQIDYNGTFEYSQVVEVEIPFVNEFSLSQNYPNPFNPTTSLQYTIGSRKFVTLKVYDLLGREVATLVNEEIPAGEYEVEFTVGQDSSPDIASGIYFYQLKAGQYSETKKMILVK